MVNRCILLILLINASVNPREIEVGWGMEMGNWVLFVARGNLHFLNLGFGQVGKLGDGAKLYEEC